MEIRELTSLAPGLRADLVKDITEQVVREIYRRGLPPVQQYFSIKEAAILLGISDRTLRNKHERGIGPKTTRLPSSNLVRFHITDLTAWWESANAADAE